MNTLATFEDLFDEVVDLWPRYKTTKTELHTAVWHRLSRYTGTDRFNVLRKHRHDNPDAMRPMWATVFSMLAATTAQESRDDFQGFLASLRTVWKRIGTKHVDEMTDADVWYNYLEAQTYPITHNTATGKPRPDLEPCTHCAALADKHPSMFRACTRMAVACDAARTRRRETEIWVRRLEEAGLAVPTYLTD